MNDLIRSLIRTLVPMVAGLIVAALAKLGYNLSSDTAVQAVGFAVAFGWYLVARLVETRWPKFGWLLGSPSAPTYGSTSRGD